MELKVVNGISLYILYIMWLCNINQVSSAKILVINWIGTKSSKNAFIPLYNELAARGHQVTILSSFKPSKPVENIREINGQLMEKTLTQLPNPFDAKLQNKMIHPFNLIPQVQHICRTYFENPEIQALHSEKFDLVMVNAYMNECAFGLIHHFNTSFIYISSMPIPSWITVFGNPSPPSFNPLILYGYSDEMTFFQRLWNFLGNIEIYLIRNYRFIQKMENIYLEYFPNAPRVHEIEKNVSLILMNSHISYNYPKAILPDMIEVGGMHCRPAKSLPQVLQTFLDDSGSDGFIYFSMGSFIQGSVMPENIRLVFLNTFAKLKQRVLWKWETETMSDLPKNVKLGSWLPQQDILGHPNIRMFLTHGGLLSTQEAVYHGVPLIGIPMVGDQDSNMEQSTRKGFALILEFSDISESRLNYLINRILNEPEFTENVKKISKSFRDNPSRPLDRAVFWTEYVLRHKGASHLRSSARDLNFIQYHSVDILVIFGTILATIIYLFYYLIRFCFRKVLGTKQRMNRVDNNSIKYSKIRKLIKTVT